VFRARPRAHENEVTNRYLGTYLNDHLAGATIGLELVKRSAREHRGSPVGDMLVELSRATEEDYQALLDLMRELGVERQRAKVLVAWTLEKVGRLKSNGTLVRRSPATPLVELEGLTIGIFGKRQCWTALQELELPATLRSRLPELIRRADDQLASIEPFRIEAAHRAENG
jgi:hypothetical protein